MHGLSYLKLQVADAMYIIMHILITNHASAFNVYVILIVRAYHMQGVNQP